MCFFKDSGAVFKYTTKPITVYKILYSDLTSPFYSYQYTIGEINKSIIGQKNTIRGCFPSMCKYYKIGGQLRTVQIQANSGAYSEGLHSYISKVTARIQMIHFNCYIQDHNPYKIYRCTIPKHSWYMINLMDEVISDQLIVEEECQV